MKENLSQYTNLITTISELLQQARTHIVQQVNTVMVQTYRNIGKYIVEYEQGGTDRAKYGTKLLEQLSEDLTKQFGKGFGVRNLQRMTKFYLTFPNYDSSAVVFQNVSWGHIERILHLKDSNEQQFFLIETAKERRSLRELDRQINSALYQRLALSKDKEGVMKLAKEGEIIQSPQDIVRSAYILEFLGLEPHHKYTERELETAIIDNLQLFLLEMGKGFLFEARQKRIRTEIDDFYVDLVFYNRLLHCYLLIDLKIGKVHHQDIGQMQMYVNWYDREVKLPEENPTIGLILCRENDEVVVKYTLSPEQEQIFSKEYQLYLPDKEQLKKLIQSTLE